MSPKSWARLALDRGEVWDILISRNQCNRVYVRAVGDVKYPSIVALVRKFSLGYGNWKQIHRMFSYRTAQWGEVTRKIVVEWNDLIERQGFLWRKRGITCLYINWTDPLKVADQEWRHWEVMGISSPSSYGYS